MVVIWLTGFLAIAACVAAGGLRKFFAARDWRLEVLAVALCVLNAGLIGWQAWNERRKSASEPPPSSGSG